MLLLEITQHPVFHLTTVTSAISILQSKLFKLAAHDQHDDDPTGMYHMSIARSTGSDFIQTMGSHGAVILVLNQNRLRANNKTKPHQNVEASWEGWTDEMEDRVYSRTPTLPIRGPLNNTILQVRLLGRTARTGGEAKFTEEQASALAALCSASGIPFHAWDVNDEQAFLAGKQIRD